MTPWEAVEMLRRAHYHLMKRREFWYDKNLIDASTILCVKASDIADEVRKEANRTGALTIMHSSACGQIAKQLI